MTRALNVQASRAAKAAGVEILKANNAEGPMVVWLREKPKRVRRSRTEQA